MRIKQTTFGLAFGFAAALSLSACGKQEAAPAGNDAMMSDGGNGAMMSSEGGSAMNSGDAMSGDPMMSGNAMENHDAMSAGNAMSKGGNDAMAAEAPRP